MLHYYVGFVVISIASFLLERIFPWNKEQKVLRKGIWQDIFWLLFNGHFLGVLLAIASGNLIQLLNFRLHELGFPTPDSLALISGIPFWLQLFVFFVLKDFIEWNIHRLLHLNSFLWEFHKLHHSIVELDWIGNFRYHWGEVVIYKTLSYLPLAVLGVEANVIIVIAIFSVLIQDLNHANLRISWGPFRYLLNSPMMHVWHHDIEQHNKGGQNFGIVLSVWDWIFKTVYWPTTKEKPEKYGFRGMENYPGELWKRLLYPIGFRQ